MRRPIVLLFLLLAGAAAFSYWHYAAARSGAMSPGDTGIQLVLRPIQRGLGVTGDWFSDLARTIFRRGGAVAENEQLREETALLREQNARLMQLQRENRELRGLLNLKSPPGGKPIAASIVAYNATDFAQKFTLNVGTRQGVKPKDVVYAAEGVIGQVVTVSPISSSVLLLNDRESGVGAMTARTRATGVLQGTGEHLCRLEYLDFNADVRVGDLVITSGKDGGSQIYPPGMTLGRIVQIERDKSYSRLWAMVEPAVHFERISAVWVRTGA